MFLNPRRPKNLWFKPARKIDHSGAALVRAGTLFGFEHQDSVNNFPRKERKAFGEGN
jgi:hypothetical protein